MESVSSLNDQTLERLHRIHLVCPRSSSLSHGRRSMSFHLEIDVLPNMEVSQGSWKELVESWQAALVVVAEAYHTGHRLLHMVVVAEERRLIEIGSPWGMVEGKQVLAYSQFQEEKTCHILHAWPESSTLHRTRDMVVLSSDRKRGSTEFDSHLLLWHHYHGYSPWCIWRRHLLLLRWWWIHHLWRWRRWRRHIHGLLLLLLLKRHWARNDCIVSDRSRCWGWWWSGIHDLYMYRGGGYSNSWEWTWYCLCCTW